MRITRVEAHNWRNFKTLDFSLDKRLFIVGPNASGKSNLLDIFRFMHDIASPGGGLAAALSKRGGLSTVRSLFARYHAKGRLVIELELDDGGTAWTYRLAVRGQQGGHNLPIVDEEVVTRDGVVLLQRPDQEDLADEARLTQTHLEQISANRDFRVLSEYFQNVEYFHLVPQVIRKPVATPAGVRDPYGATFLTEINATTPRTRKAWLDRIQRALQQAVPEFSTLELDVDPSGAPHLVAGFKNWRKNPTRHRESEFSDGTLRLIGLLWTVISTPSRDGRVLLLEEPELSLNSAIVKSIPSMLAQTRRGPDHQVILSTHAPALVDDEGISPEEVLVLRVTPDGTRADLLSEIDEVRGQVEAELPFSDIVDGLIAMPGLDELSKV